MGNEIELLRRALNKLPRYLFLKDKNGNVRKVLDSTGNYIDWNEAHALFDPEYIDNLKEAINGRTTYSRRKAAQVCAHDR